MNIKLMSATIAVFLVSSNCATSIEYTRNTENSSKTLELRTTDFETKKVETARLILSELSTPDSVIFKIGEVRYRINKLSPLSMITKLPEIGSVIREMQGVGEGITVSFSKPYSARDYLNISYANEDNSETYDIQIYLDQLRD